MNIGTTTAPVLNPTRSVATIELTTRVADTTPATDAANLDKLTITANELVTMSLEGGRSMVVTTTAIDVVPITSNWIFTGSAFTVASAIAEPARYQFNDTVYLRFAAATVPPVGSSKDPYSKP
jgi:hypothetical protein